MSHHHDNHHVHTTAQSPLNVEEQLATLISHWIEHNKSHAGTYRDWAQKASVHHLKQAAKELREIANLTLLINDKLEGITVPEVEK